MRYARSFSLMRFNHFYCCVAVIVVGFAQLQPAVAQSSGGQSQASPGTNGVPGITVTPDQQSPDHGSGNDGGRPGCRYEDDSDLELLV